MTAGSRLLLVEDDAPLRRMLCLALADEGYDVLEAADAEAAFRRLEERPDAVLLDLLLPDAHGLDVLRRIRAATPIPVVVISALSAAEDVDRGLAAGADDYLTKPFLATELARRLQAVFAARDQRDVTTPGPDIHTRRGNEGKGGR